MGQLIDIRKAHLAKSIDTYLFTHPERLYMEKEKELAHVLKTLQQQSTLTLEHFTNPYNQVLSKLETLNPLLTMKRGYSITRREGEVITSSKQVKKDDVLDITLADGSITSKVV